MKIFSPIRKKCNIHFKGFVLLYFVQVSAQSFSLFGKKYFIFCYKIISIITNYQQTLRRWIIKSFQMENGLMHLRLHFLQNHRTWKILYCLFAFISLWKGRNFDIPKNNILSQLFLLSVSSRGLWPVVNEEEHFPELSMSNVYPFPRAKSRLMSLSNDFQIRFNYFRKKIFPDAARSTCKKRCLSV